MTGTPAPQFVLVVKTERGAVLEIVGPFGNEHRAYEWAVNQKLFRFEVAHLVLPREAGPPLRPGDRVIADGRPATVTNTAHFSNASHVEFDTRDPRGGSRFQIIPNEDISRIDKP